MKINLDPEYLQTIDHDSRTPAQMLFLAIIFRAFKDAIGQNSDCNTAQQKRNSRVTAINFILNREPSEFGTAQTMCVLATGTDSFWRRLVEIVTNQNYVKSGLYLMDEKWQKLDLLEIES